MATDITTVHAIAARCKASLGKFYDYRDVRDNVFDGDLNLLLDAVTRFDLPPEVQVQCEATLPARTVEIHALRLVLRELERLRQDVVVLRADVTLATQRLRKDG